MPTICLPSEPQPEALCHIGDPPKSCTVVIQLKHGRSGAALTIALLTRLVEEQELGSVIKFAMGDHL